MYIMEHMLQNKEYGVYITKYILQNTYLGTVSQNISYGTYIMKIYITGYIIQGRYYGISITEFIYIYIYYKAKCTQIRNGRILCSISTPVRSWEPRIWAGRSVGWRGGRSAGWAGGRSDVGAVDRADGRSDRRAAGRSAGRPGGKSRGWLGGNI